MKRIRTIAGVLLIMLSYVANAQNTFPSTGNVGVGTTNPSEELDVMGDVRVEGLRQTPPAPGVTLRYVMVDQDGKLISGQPRIEIPVVGGMGGVPQIPDPGSGCNGSVIPANSWREFQTTGQGGNTSMVELCGYTSLRVPELVFTKNIYAIGGTSQLDIMTANDATLGTVYITTGATVNDDMTIGGELTTSHMTTGTLGVSNDASIGGQLSVDGKLKLGILSPTSGTAHDDYVLSVNGKAVMKDVVVTLDNWADHVFADDYSLRPLEEVETYIEQNKHLPDVPSEQEVMENGSNLGQMDVILLQKVEELTLYVIQLQKQNEDLQKQLDELKQ